MGFVVVAVWFFAGCGGGSGKPATVTPPSAASAAATARATGTDVVPVTPTVAATGTTAADSSTPVPATAVPDAGATSAAAAAMCANAAEVMPSATVASNDLVELSGIASARANDGLFWAHNDSGDTARAFVFDATGAAIATYSLAGADAFDWEDMASGSDASRGAAELYFGDIGDNARARTEIAVYRVREPRIDRAAAPIAGTLTNVEKLTLRYPDGPHDAETLMIDPVSGDLIIVTKDAGGSQVFRAPGTLDANATATLEQVARIDFAQLTKHAPFPDDAPALARAGGALADGGDISPAGDMIAIRTYSAVWLWSRAPGRSIGDALAAAPCEAPSAAEQQGEAIAFDADSRGYVTSTEGAHPPLHHFRAN